MYDGGFEKSNTYFPTNGQLLEQQASSFHALSDDFSRSGLRWFDHINQPILLIEIQLIGVGHFNDKFTIILLNWHIRTDLSLK